MVAMSTREPTEDELEAASVALAGIHSLIDPMSGRIDNWSER